MPTTAAQDNWRKLIEAKPVPSSDTTNGHGVAYRILLSEDGREIGRVPVNGRYTGTKKHKEFCSAKKRRK